MNKPKHIKQIKKLKKKSYAISLNKLFSGYTGNYKPVEINWCNPVGKEIQ